MEIIMQVGMIGLGFRYRPHNSTKKASRTCGWGRQWRENRGLAGKVLDWEDTVPNPSSVT